MALLRVLRPLLGVLATLVLAVLVVADRLGMGQRPLHLSPRQWAILVFPIQAFSFVLGRAIRGRRKVRRPAAHLATSPRAARLSNLEFAEICALMLTVGYWFMIDERLDTMLRPGWRVVLLGILVLIPIMAKLVTERTEA